jgi:hypothetical protein
VDLQAVCLVHAMTIDAIGQIMTRQRKISMRLRVVGSTTNHLPFFEHENVSNVFMSLQKCCCVFVGFALFCSSTSADRYYTSTDRYYTSTDHYYTSADPINIIKNGRSSQ